MAKKDNKERTVRVSNELAKRVSIFNGKFEPVEGNKGWRWEKSIQDPEIPGFNFVMAVNSYSPLTGFDGKYIDYIFSQVQAINAGKGEGEKLDTLHLTVSNLVRATGMANTWQQRKRVIESIKKTVGLTVEIKHGKKTTVFNLIDKIEIIEDMDLVEVRVSKSYEEFMTGDGIGRFINIKRVMPLKSPTAIELSKFLQARGPGVDGKTRAPRVSQGIFSLSEVVQFLHLEGMTLASAVKIVERALTILHKEAGFPKYKRKTRPGSKGGVFGEGGEPEWRPVKESGEIF